MSLYRQAFNLGMQRAMRYRANFFMGFFSFIFPLLIQYFLWISVFRSSSDDIVLGYSLPQILSYSVFAVITGRIVASNFIFEVNDEIKQGGLSKYLVKPMRYLPYRACCFLGEKVVAIILSLGIVLFVSFGVNFLWRGTIDYFNIVYYVISLCLSIILNFLMFYSICGMGFWTRDASGAVFIITVVGNLLSGGVFPIDIFSEEIQSVLKILPFSYTNFFPVSILCGRTEYHDIVQGMMFQIIWIVILYLVSEIVWGIGLKKYVSVGG